MTSFVFRGNTIDLVSPTIGEMLTLEHILGKSSEDWSRIATAAAGWWFAIRRWQLTNGVTPLMTWEEMLNVSPDDIDEVPEPEAKEVNEENLPLDPTGGGDPTGDPSESDPQNEKASQVDAVTTSGSSLSGSTTPPTTLTD